MNSSLSITSLSLAVLFSLNARSQQVCWFEAGHTDYYKITACIPNSDIEFYSDKTGGRVLKQATVDAEGSYCINSKKNFNPAFVLNVKHPNTKGITGSGIVHFFDTKEFSIDDVAINATQNTATLTFKAQSDPAKDIYFDILKSKDGINFSVIGKIDANNSGIQSLYTFTDNDNDASFYKVRVVNAQEGERYATGLLFAESGIAKIYPTVATSTFSIALDKQYSNATYTIYSADGRLVSQGDLHNMITGISVGNWATGSYIVLVYAGTHKTVARLQKI
jgi:hypothetical protein